MIGILSYIADIIIKTSLWYYVKNGSTKCAEKLLHQYVSSEPAVVRRSENGRGEFMNWSGFRERGEQHLKSSSLDEIACC